DTLDAFAAAAGTRWGCLVGAGRVRASTRRWGALPSAERALLAALLLPRGAGPGGEATPTAAARDLPVYLPQSSPTVPHRLLALGLVGGVAVALLCGPRPPLQHVITQLVPQFWGPVLEQLRGCGRGPPAPPPRGVLAYLLVHHQQGWTQSGVSRGGAQAGVLPPQRRGAALRHLYALMAPKYCPEEGAPPPGEGGTWGSGVSYGSGYGV
ncbi:protein fuzzy homolog, partial [Pezoporus wallicus]|uniref:protein fuzzy homolog n=1 Tax=Pezoporus wallicus TaxID=35540 RepID=UPI0025517B5B